MDKTVIKIQKDLHKCVRKIFLVIVICPSIYHADVSKTTTNAQSIGYHPQFNYGFNPYLSPVFGYGLGLPFGAYSMAPTRYPWLMNSIISTPYSDKNGFLSQLHTKAFLKKLATSQVLSANYYGLKDKLNLIKNPNYAYTPYGSGYGYGKHYGAAVVTNDPYKGKYGDYFESQAATMSRPLVTSTTGEQVKYGQIPIGGRPAESTLGTIAPIPSVKSYSHYLKPLIKVGALLTTAALLGKKALESPIRLNPSGMILSGTSP